MNYDVMIVAWHLSKMGAVDYFQKGNPLQELAEKVNAVLSQQK